MYKLLCADMRKIFLNKMFWIVILCVSVLCIGGFSLLELIIAKARNITEMYADTTLTLYPSVATIVIGAFVGSCIGTEFREGTLRNKLAIGAKRSDIFLAAAIVIAIAASIFQVIATLSAVLFGNLLLDGFNMGVQEIVQSTLVYTAASIATAFSFTTVCFGLGNGKISSMICIMIGVVLKFVCTENVSKLYPSSGECALTGAEYSFCSFIDKYVPFSYLNGGVRYEMSCYAVGCIATVGIAVLVGLRIFQRKDMK